MGQSGTSTSVTQAADPWYKGQATTMYGQGQNFLNQNAYQAYPGNGGSTAAGFQPLQLAAQDYLSNAFLGKAPAGSPGWGYQAPNVGGPYQSRTAGTPWGTNPTNPPPNGGGGGGGGGGGQPPTDPNNPYGPQNPRPGGGQPGDPGYNPEGPNGYNEGVRALSSYQNTQSQSAYDPANGPPSWNAPGGGGVGGTAGSQDEFNQQADAYKKYLLDNGLTDASGANTTTGHYTGPGSWEYGANNGAAGGGAGGGGAGGGGGGGNGGGGANPYGGGGANAGGGWDPSMGYGQGNGIGQAQTAAGVAQGIATNGGLYPKVQGGNVLGQMGGYQNAYNDQVVNQSLNDIERARQLATQQDNSNSTLAGAFGGDRSALVNSETNRAYADQSARTAAQLRSQGFDTAASLAQQDAGRGLTAGLANQQGFFNSTGQQLQGAGLLSSLGGDIYNRNLGTAQALSGVGAEQQGQAQSQIGADYAQWQQAQQDPYNRFGFLSGLLSGVPQSQTSTSYVPGNRAAGFAGGALSGAGIGSAFGPLGAGIGGGLGGLLGLF